MHRTGWLLAIFLLGDSPTRADAQVADTSSLAITPVLERPDAPVPTAQVDQPVRVRYCPAPHYPTALAEYGLPGRVELVFVVDTAGHPELENLVVVEASNAGFISSARRAIGKCRYDPARQGGRPVRFRVQQGVVFHPAPEPGR